MKTKLVWSILSCIMVAALILASCAPAVVEEKEATVVTKEPEKKVEKVEEVAKPVGPQYGGEFNGAYISDRVGFDDAKIAHIYTPSLLLTNEKLWVGDWAKGPQGTGEYNFYSAAWPGIENCTGALAESWELVDGKDFVIHVRPGVFWHNKPPLNGREVTAADIAYNLIRASDPQRCKVKPVQTFTKEGFLDVQVIDKYTVKVVCPSKLTAMYLIYIFGMLVIKPPEIIEEYGDTTDWKNSIGTGPFMLTDYVPNEIITLERNPAYWMHDPLHPENRLPYLDRVNFYLIGGDTAVQLAALRTGKIDFIEEIALEQGAAAVRINPSLKHIEFLSNRVDVLGMRLDRTPYSDVRVRRAMMLAIDQQEIVRDYYNGKAEFFNYYLPPYYPDIYVKYEDAPEDVSILYEYHPDLAKKLLAEAGYPDGFECEVLTDKPGVEKLTIIQSYFLDVGIDMHIQVMEAGAFTALRRAYDPQQHEDLIFGRHGQAVPFQRVQWDPLHFDNYTNIEIPGYIETYDFTMNNFFEPGLLYDKIKEFEMESKRNVYFIAFPTTYAYRMWTPWVKGYSGEWCVGNQTRYGFPPYIWIDAALKKEMTGVE